MNERMNELLVISKEYALLNRLTLEVHWGHVLHGHVRLHAWLHTRLHAWLHTRLHVAGLCAVHAWLRGVAGLWCHAAGHAWARCDHQLRLACNTQAHQ